MVARIEKFAFGPRRPGPRDNARGAIHIGLVNNMPDQAMRATELQFARLLKEAAGPYDVRLHLFSIAGIARGEVAASRMEGFYADVETLPGTALDALIVTGAEPQAQDLRDEPYWHALAHLVDWAEIGTISTLFSCLAAHAAVLHLDGVVRRPLAHKLFGVFASHKAGEHPLLGGFPPRAATPHSRRNKIAEHDLAGKNYEILSRLADGEVDVFVRPGRSQFVFLQGHPEYGPETLGREYCRDMGRWLRGEGARPALPEHYFDPATANALEELAAGADARDLARFQDIVGAAIPCQSWHSHTLKLFSNWLVGVAVEKSRRVHRHQPARKRLSA